MKRLANRIGAAAAIGVLAIGAAGASRPNSVAAADAASGRFHGRQQGTILTLGANQSSNWSGYNQGLLEKGTLFNSVSGTWVVPTATQRTAGQPESSSVWIGIGGGCLESTCLLTDPTLIQVGTEQDVDGSGNPTYFAWWEIIPLPSLQTSLPVAPGQQITASISQIIPELWQIQIRNDSTGQSFSTTIPYPSTFGTVEWIVETPLVISTDSAAGLASMPNLGNVSFSSLKVNGGNPQLSPDEALDLVQNGQLIAEPSAPSGGNSFSVCVYPPNCAH